MLHSLKCHEMQFKAPHSL